MKKSIRPYFLGAVLLFIAPLAQAAIIGVTSEAGLSATDSIHWGDLGSQLTYVPSNTTGTTTDGDGYTVSNAVGGFVRLDQGSSWFGNFGSGDTLLNSLLFGPINIVFADAVSGAGAQIQSLLPGAFTAKIEAFDALNNSLGSFTQKGFSNFAGDDSAIFVGILSDASDISRIRFSLTSATWGTVNKFSIGDVALTGGVDSVPTPEPSTFALIGGALILAAYRFRR